MTEPTLNHLEVKIRCLPFLTFLVEQFLSGLEEEVEFGVDRMDVGGEGGDGDGGGVEACEVDIVAVSVGGRTAEYFGGEVEGGVSREYGVDTFCCCLR